MVLTIVNGKVVWSLEKRDELLKEVDRCERIASKYLDRIDALGREVGDVERPPFLRWSGREVE